MFTQYNCHIGNFWKVPTNSIKRTIDYHRDMVEPNKYMNNVENLERWLMIKNY